MKKFIPIFSLVENCEGYYNKDFCLISFRLTGKYTVPAGNNLTIPVTLFNTPFKFKDRQTVILWASYNSIGVSGRFNEDGSGIIYIKSMYDVDHNLTFDNTHFCFFIWRA